MKIIKVSQRADSQATCESSPDLTPSEPFKLVMMSPPGSTESIDKHVVEEDGEFHTPPEQHSHSHLSSSEDQNPNEWCSEVLMSLRAGDGANRAKNARVPEAASDDEPESKRIRAVAEEELDGDTVRLGETEVVEIEEDDGVQDAEVIVLDSGDSNGKPGASLEKHKAGERSNKSGVGGSEKVLEISKDAAEVIVLDSGDSNGKPAASLEKHKAGERSNKSGVGGSEEVLEISKDAERPKDSHRDEGVRVKEKRFADIEGFRYEGGSCRPRKLPPTLKGKEDGLSEASEKKGGLLDENVMAWLQAYLGDTRHGPEGVDPEGVDFIETAKKRGMKFPRPRWWLPEDEK